MARMICSSYLWFMEGEWKSLCAIIQCQINRVCMCLVCVRENRHHIYTHIYDDYTQTPPHKHKKRQASWIKKWTRDTNRSVRTYRHTCKHFHVTQCRIISYDILARACTYEEENFILKTALRESLINHQESVCQESHSTSLPSQSAPHAAPLELLLSTSLHSFSETLLELLHPSVSDCRPTAEIELDR